MNIPILFFWFILTGSALVSALPCINTTFLTPFSPYDINRRLVLTSLASNVTAHRGFYNVSIGQLPDKVYAAGMCIPGTEPEICSDCIRSGSYGLIENCLNQKEASIWYSNRTLCMIRYSERSFIGSLELEPRVDVFNPMDLKTNATEFSTAWKGLTHRMIGNVSSNKDTAWSGGRYYAADAEALPDSQTLYGLMWCTPDLSSSECNLCLNKSVTIYQQSFLGQQGGSIIGLSCILRTELFPFFRAFQGVLPKSVSSPPVLKPPPPPTPSIPNVGNVTKTGGGKRSTIRTTVALVVPIVVATVIIIIIILGFLARRFSVLCWKRKPDQDIDFDQSGITSLHSLQFDFKTIEAATEKFSLRNKLGQGGFGEVFKGTLRNGTEVAVKRLSKTSSQGAQEFKNEVVVVAKLQHRNLVRLLGFCLDGEEKILVYEFVPNKSLDYFLFDSTKKKQLDWKKRYKIIVGITRGILYLHQDSRLTIIHRDLKASNILLDADMDPKIADFGMARIFGIDQTGANTSRIVGTHGYMSPEYLIHGKFSMKSDVYSFGVLVLEIICGKKNSSFHQTSDNTVENLVTYAWKVWRDGTPLELLDPTILENYHIEEVTRCIHIGLLCVQEDPSDRPSLSTINLMLTSNTLILPVPQPPGFYLPKRRNQERGSEGFSSSQSTNKSTSMSINDVTITELDPR